MNELDISDWIINNKALFNVNLNDDLDLTLNKLKNGKLVGEKDYGYYYYYPSGFRFGFSENKIDEIGIEFSQTDLKILLTQDGSKINLSTETIHKVLDFLNEMFIVWEPINEIDKSCLVVKLKQSNIYFVFDIYSGKLVKIFKSIGIAPAGNSRHD